MESPKVHRTLLGVVAESLVARSSARQQTVVDVVHGRALQHYGEALRQYLTIRLGDHEAGLKALSQVRALAAARGAEAMAAQPGIRARLYRVAREVVAGMNAAGDQVPAPAGVPWRVLPLGTPANYAAAVADLRTGLDAEKAEIVELRHARELSVDEVAFVLARPAEDVATVLASAEREARFILGEGTVSSEGFGRAVLDAFSLEREPAGTITPTDEEISATLAPGTIIGGRYEIQKCVGSGSFADVYRSRDMGVPGHLVAIKLLHQPSRTEEARQIALRELHLIASVFHPSIVQFKDHGWHESRLWFVMPWYEGESLEDRIQREPLTRPEARRIFEQLARALATMHASGLRHQDVKPDNIFLARIKHFDADGGGEILPVLLDLGVAAKDAEMVVAGTPTYFAPEVAAQFSKAPSSYEITNRADVFALALSLRNALEPASEEDVPGGAVEMFIEHRSQNVPPSPVGADLKYLAPHFARWLHLDPTKRPTAGELAKELAVLTAPEEKRERRVALLKWAVPLAVAVAVAFVAAVVVLRKQTEFQALQAKQARLETVSVRADLSVATERGNALESDIGVIQQRYENSKLTSQELTSKLARTEGQLNATTDDLGRVRRRASALDESLAKSQADNTSLNTQLTGTTAQLSRTRADLAASQSAYAAEQAASAALRRDVAQARAETTVALERVASTNRELTQARGDLTVARDDNRDLARQVKQLEALRQQAEDELAASEKRVRRLEKQLAAATAGAPTGTTPVNDRPTSPAVPVNP